MDKDIYVTLEELKKNNKANIEALFINYFLEKKNIKKKNITN
ncbi:hypothetical protein U9J35_16885 [Rossellomorea aquimaris]|nr:hypothetical protein [Rossellomorea aquimaris]WRP05576.1 hypothetical protein U9J35_16885 [Rossellomorea aquimaris]